MTATTINRTPFRKVFDIPAHLLISDRLKWESTQGTVALTTNGTRFAHVNDGKLGYWWTTKEAEFRPLGMTWEAAEALVASPSPQPQPAQQPKAEEPFRPGLPPAEMRAVCEEWESCCRAAVAMEPVDFVDDCYRFLNNPEGERKSPSELAAALTWGVGKKDFFRPLGRTWADVEAAAKAVSSSPPHLPKDGDKALDEAATRRQPGKVGNYSHVAYVNPWPRRTFIITSPPGRRKYAKLLLKRLGYRNLDKIPMTDMQAPYDLGRGLPDHERENLLAIAPGVVLRDVL